MVAAWNRWELDGIIKYWAPDVLHYSGGHVVETDEMIRRMEAGLRDRTELWTLPGEDHFRGALDTFLAAVRGERDLAAHGERTLTGLMLLDAVRAATEN